LRSPERVAFDRIERAACPPEWGSQSVQFAMEEDAALLDVVDVG
jgi:hypothetical protein